MNLSLFEPIHTHDAFDRVFDSFFGNGRAPTVARSEAQTWRPAAEFSASEEAYTLKLDVPGVEQDAIDVSVDDGALKVSGERKSNDEPSEDGKVYRREVTYGAFSRTLRLPDDADLENVTATYANGVLTVSIPKAEAEVARKIPITVQ